MPGTSSHRFSFTQRQSASNKTPRQINRNLVFNLIRMRQPVSRADIARISGLQRSTVSLIVEDLLRDKWIVEGSTGRLPRGRRPTFLQLNDHRAVIALDIHPSQTTVAVTGLGGRVVSQCIVVLPEDSTKAIQAMIAAVRKLIADNPDRTFEGIGISLPGRADLHLQKLIFAPNLHWPVLSLNSRIQRATGLRVEMDNAANACALSEVWFGDSDGTHDIVAVNVSEGIGTGIFANGRLLRGQDGMAGEFGHVQMKANGPPCACGSLGCWETLASNRAGLRYYHEMGGNGNLQGFESLIKLSLASDRTAIRALEKMSVFLGQGLRMIASALAPNEIVVVGDITAAWHRFGPIIEAELNRNSLSKSIKLRPSAEGSTARLRSAVALVMSDGL